MTGHVDDLNIALVAGESSGDQLASELLKGLHTAHRQVNAVGIAGEAMVRQGVNAWWSSQSLAVRGYFEPIKHLPRIFKMRSELIARLSVMRPDVFVGIDAPDFNLGVERRLRENGIKTMHYVSPSIWSWRPKRIEKIRAAANHVLLIFPFEKRIYADAGIAATYVGHPFASHIPMQANPNAARQALLLDSKPKTIIALLPGSRASEITYNAPAFFQAAVLLEQQLGNVSFILPVAHEVLLPKIHELREKYAPNIDLHLFNGQARSVMEAADAVLCASGTASLEVALYKKPMVISYQTSAASVWLYHRVALLPWIGLANILLNESFIPEVLQHDATPQNLAKTLLFEMNRYANDVSVVERLSVMHHSLMADTSSLCAQAVAQVVAKS